MPETFFTLLKKSSQNKKGLVRVELLWEKYKMPRSKNFVQTWRTFSNDDLLSCSFISELQADKLSLWSSWHKYLFGTQRWVTHIKYASMYSCQYFMSWHNISFSLFPWVANSLFDSSYQESWFKHSCIHQSKCWVWGDENNFCDSLPVCLIEGIGHYDSGKRHNLNFMQCKLFVISNKLNTWLLSSHF